MIAEEMSIACRRAYSVDRVLEEIEAQSRQMETAAGNQCDVRRFRAAGGIDSRAGQARNSHRAFVGHDGNFSAGNHLRVRSHMAY